MSSLLQLLKLNEYFSSLLPPFSFKYLVLLAIFLILIYKWALTSINSPPSPPKLPIIGNLHQLGLLPHRSLQTLAQRYGPLMLLHFGSAPVLVVSSAEAAREIMKTHDQTFANRPKLIFFKKLCYNYKDVASAPYGEYYKQLKSVCVMNLLSNKRVRSFRAVREEETKSMVNVITKHSSSTSSSALNLSEVLATVIFDIICRVTMGRRYSDHGEGGMFMALSNELVEMMARVNIGDYIPWLAWFTRFSGLDAEIDDLGKRFDHFLETVVQEHMDAAQIKTEDQKDIVDVLLSLQKENAAIDRVSIKGIILDMFAGGTDTTTATLEWTMSELIRHPRVMARLQSEVRGTVSGDRSVIDDDLVGMPYVKAVIKETLRLHPPAPLLLPKMSTKDVQINGYDIKANTQVMINAWHIGRDPKYFDKPEEYEPERFLNSAVDYKGNDFQFIPFGGGRRGCPGIQFAVAVEEIALANLVHKFDWVMPAGERAEDLDMTETSGASVHKKDPLKLVPIPVVF